MVGRVGMFGVICGIYRDSLGKLVGITIIVSQRLFVGYMRIGCWIVLHSCKIKRNHYNTVCLTSRHGEQTRCWQLYMHGDK